jgi:hypothetical protein
MQNISETHAATLWQKLAADLSSLRPFETCGLYYKTITIVIMMIVSDATIWSVTYDRN